MERDSATVRPLPTTPERLPRHDVEAEQAVLGAVLLDNATLPLIEAMLIAEDFYQPSHALIFECMHSLSAEHQPIDVATLRVALEVRNRLNTIGGRQYLDDLSSAVVTTAYVEAHARIVADDARARRIGQQAAKVATMALSRSYGLEAIDHEATTGMVRAASPRDDARVVDFADAIFEAMSALTQGRAGLMGLATGFRDFDARTTGLPVGLTILAARPSMGKTALAFGMAVRIARAERDAARREGRSPKRVLFASLETPRVNLSVRAIAGAALVAQQTLRRCDLDADQAVAMNRAADELSTLPLRILDTGRLRLSEFVGIAARERMRGGLLAAVIDYLQLLKPDERSDSREREVSEVARGLKGLALDLGVPLLALSQLNRACETRPNKRPMMSDLRESGEIEQAADLVTFLYRDEVYNKTSPDKGIAEWIIAKQKDGPLGPVRLAWQAECTRFDDLAPGDGDTAPDAHASFDDFTHETDEDP